MLDDELNDQEFSSNMKSLGRHIGQWAKIIAVISIVIQVLEFFTTVFSRGGFIGPLITLGISIGLYAALLQFGKAMTTFSEMGNMSTLAEAMYRQRIYWQFLGIILIIALFFGLIFVMMAGENAVYMLQGLIR